MASAPNPHSDTDQTLVLSYLTLRRTLGVIGVLLPLVLVVGDSLLERWGIRPSISAYYYTGMRDVMVAAMAALGVFLIAYTGYDRSDNIHSSLAGIGILGVALLPTQHPCLRIDECTEAMLGQVPVWWMDWVSTAHDVSALLFMVMIGWLAMFQFTKSNDPQPTDQKLRRNMVYRCTAVIIFVCAILLVLRALGQSDVYEPILGRAAVFIIETVALVSFGIAWATKGEILWPDRRSGGGGGA